MTSSWKRVYRLTHLVNTHCAQEFIMTTRAKMKTENCHDAHFVYLVALEVVSTNTDTRNHYWHGNVIVEIFFRATGPLRGESTGHRWIPLTKASDAELWCFLWSAPEQTMSKQSRQRWFETPSRSLWHHSNGGHSIITRFFWTWIRTEYSKELRRVRGNGCIYDTLTQWHGYVYCITDPLWWESIGHRWIPLTIGSYLSLSWISYQTVDDAMAPMWRHCYEPSCLPRLYLPEPRFHVPVAP